MRPVDPLAWRQVSPLLDRALDISDEDRAGGATVTAAVPITSEAGEETWPAFSPDGTRLVFSWLPPQALDAHLAIKTIGPNAVAELTQGPGADTMPVWSPDGRFIAFLRSFREPEMMTQVCLMPAAGGPPRVLHAERHISAGLAWRRTIRPSSPDVPDKKVMTLPRDAHWGGEWVVRERGIYYVNPHSTSGAAIELLPFRPAGRARPIRILPLAAPPSGGAPFTIASDESWLTWSQEDHRAGDIMMIDRVP